MRVSLRLRVPTSPLKRGQDKHGCNPSSSASGRPRCAPVKSLPRCTLGTRPVHTRSIAASAPAWALVGPPVAPALDVFAGSLAEIGRADDEDLEALRPGLVASPRIGRDTHRVALLELDDLVVELHPPAPAQDDVHLLLFLVRVAVREAIAGRDALVAQAGLLEFERLGGQAELQVRWAVES